MLQQAINALTGRGHSVAESNIPGLFRVDGGPEITTNQLMGLAAGSSVNGGGRAATFEVLSAEPPWRFSTHTVLPD